MGSPVSSVQIFKFGLFELDVARNTLSRNGVRVKIQDQPFRVLLLLLKRPGEIVSREDLRQTLWPEGTYVDFDGSLNVTLKKLRAAIDDDSDNPRFIETVPRRGYRFIAPVSVSEGNNGSAPLSSAIAPAVRQTKRSFWILWAVAGFIVAAAVLVVLVARQASGPERVMLVVLPLQNFSGDPQQDYLADGVTEEIITELGSLDPKHLGVIARTSAMQYKRGTKDIAQVSRELGVGYVLEGSVRRSSNNLRVTAQLIRSSDQTHLWAQSYDGDLGDVLKLESNIALEVAGQIRLALSEETHERLTAPAHVNPEAHDAYLRGLQGWNQRNPQGFREAMGDFTRATQLAPDYAAAFAQLARVYSLAPIFGGMQASEAVPKALEAANHAFALDETLADAHTALAFTKVHYLHDWTSAEKELRRAVELEPNNPYAHFFYSNSFLSPTGRHQEAIAEMKKAMELDPLSTRIQSFAGRTYIYARHYDDALAQFQRVNQLDPDFPLNHERLSHLDAMLGKFEEAIAEEAKARALSGENSESIGEKLDRLSKASRTGGAQEYWKAELELSRSAQNPPEAYTGALGMAIIYSHLGNKDNAFANLETAYNQRDEEMTNLAVEPQFDPLRSDRRFTDLEKRIGIRAQ